MKTKKYDPSLDIKTPPALLHFKLTARGGGILNAAPSGERRATFFKSVGEAHTLRRSFGSVVPKGRRPLAPQTVCKAALRHSPDRGYPRFNLRKIQLLRNSAQYAKRYFRKSPNFTKLKQKIGAISAPNKARVQN